MNGSQGELNDIALFVGIVRAGGVSPACAALGVPRSTISRALQRLEARLGLKLARRTPRAFALTDAGRAFYERVHGPVDALRAAPAELASTEAGPTLRITIPVLIAHFLLPAALALFRARYPTTGLRILVDDARRDIEGGGLDLAVRVGDPGGEARVGRTLCTSVRRLYAAPAYIARHGAPRTLEELHRHPLIACVPMARIDEAVVWSLNEGGIRRNVTVTPVVAMNDPEAALAMAEAGQGIAKIPDFVATEALSRGSVRRVLPDVQSSPRPIRALLTDGRQAVEEVRALADAFATAAAEMMERSHCAASAAEVSGLLRTAGADR